MSIKNISKIYTSHNGIDNLWLSNIEIDIFR